MIDVHSSASFVVDVAVVLGVGAITGIGARAIRLPSVLGYLAAGLIVGPYLPIPVFADPGRVQTLATFGVVLVMFAVGLEFRFARLIKILPVSGFTALVQIGVMLWAGFSLGRMLGWDPVSSSFLAAALAISSTMLVTGLFAQRPADKELSEHVLGVLVVQDVAAIALIAAMTAVAAGRGLAPAELAAVVGQLAAVLVGIIAVGIIVVPRAIRAVVARGWFEPLTVLAVGLAFAFAVLAEALGYSAALGAFVAGILVAESGKGHEVERAIGPLRDVFAAIFFVSVGMLVDPLLALRSWQTVLAIVMVIVVGQFGSVAAASLMSGLPLRRAVKAGLALGQIGEFSFILAAIGTSAGVVPDVLVPSLVAAAALTALTTPLLLDRSEVLNIWLDRCIPGRVHRLLAVYQRWVLLMRQASGTNAKRWRRTLIGLGLDGLGLTVLGTVMAASGPRLATWLSHSASVGKQGSTAIVVSVGLLLAAPLVVGLLANGRRLATLTSTILLGEADGDADRGLARELMHAIVHLLVLTGLGVPAVAAIRPWLGMPVSAPLLLAAVLAAALLVWRRAAGFEGTLRSGAEQVAQLLAAQADLRPERHAHRQGEPAGRPTPAHLPREPGAPPAGLLPGLDGVVTLELSPEASSIGKTLAEIDLRARSGVTVVAIRQADGTEILPHGRERLAAGDMLALIGPRERMPLARQLLLAAPERGGNRR